MTDEFDCAEQALAKGDHRPAKELFERSVVNAFAGLFRNLDPETPVRIAERANQMLHKEGSHYRLTGGFT